MGIIIGILITFTAILYNLFLGSFLQRSFGSIGLALTEVGFAFIALVGVLIYTTLKRRRDSHSIENDEYTIESAFSFRLPRFRHIVGGIMLMIGGYFLTSMYYNIVMRIFPDVYAQLSKSIGSATYSKNLAVMLCSMAVIPAVCEELLVRGAIQKCFGDFKKPLYTILLTGLMFGLFHIDPIRIPFATVMGILLSYAYYRSGSILVPILMHFVNNAYAAVGTWLSYSMTSAAPVSPLTEPWMELLSGAIASAGMTAIALFALITGAMFLEPNFLESIKKYKKTAVVFGGYTAFLGIGMFVCIAVFGF